MEDEVPKFILNMNFNWSEFLDLIYKTDQFLTFRSVCKPAHKMYFNIKIFI